MTGAVKVTVDDPLALAWADCSDLGNSQRLEVISGGKLLWIEEEKCWAAFDTQRWSMKTGERAAQLLAHQVVEHIDLEAAKLAEICEDQKALTKKFGEWCSTDIAQKRVETLRGHAVRSGSAGMTNGMLKQAQSAMSASIDDFDADPLAYNVQNGTIRFVRDSKAEDPKWEVRFADHDPVDMLMNIADVEYDPEAGCKFWDQRINMLVPDPQQRHSLKRLYGYTLTGLVSDQSFYVHQGKGGDGKSATHIFIGEMHGDYFRHAGVETFLQSRQKGGAEHRSDLVRLQGDVRFVSCDEPAASAVWDGKTIKQVTGSLVTARAPNAKTDITYKPRFKLIVECNTIPRAPSDDKGFRRRFKLYQWRVSIEDTPDGEMPEDLVMQSLRDEAPGVLNWLIEGALQWLETREIPIPESINEVMKDFWADSSPMLEWMSEWCDTSDVEAKEPASELYSHFKKWCEDAGIEKIMSSTKFGSTLRDKQFTKWRDPKGGRIWRVGIALRRESLFNMEAPQNADTAATAADENSGGDIGGKDVLGE